MQNILNPKDPRAQFLRNVADALDTFDYVALYNLTYEENRRTIEKISKQEALKNNAPHKDLKSECHNILELLVAKRSAQQKMLPMLSRLAVPGAYPLETERIPHFKNLIESDKAVQDIFKLAIGHQSYAL